MSEDPTLPPIRRKWWQQAMAWCAAHPDWLLMFALGFLAGAVLL